MSEPEQVPDPTPAPTPGPEPVPVVLAEPVRQRLVELAAEVLARLPADDVPAALRAIARFTPAKRVRLGAPALAAALDADEGFRARVADAVAETTPQLVEAVRRHEPTTASDPIDTAVVAYLVRPDGWSELVSGVGEQWTGEQAAREAAKDEIARLRAEVAELRSQLRTESARRDDVVAEAAQRAAAAASEEATRLRNLLRSRTAELRAAATDAEQARAELGRVAAELDAYRAGEQDRLAELRERIAELERAGDAARRDSRAGREVDDARLRLLLDTLTDAAAGVRRELALPAGTLRPADAVLAGEVGDAAGTRVDLDRLLALPQAHLIVDGYNVTKTGYPDLPLADQRARLIAALAAVHARTGAEITIAFDGGARPPVQPRTPRGVRVLFSVDEIADDLIRRLVGAEPPGRPLLVVSSDRAVATDVRRAGAWAVPSAALLDRLG
jgi:predicted RNA-binding protein with PIN domain